MKNAHTRKKDPSLVRQALLDSAAKIAVEHGFAAITIQTVAAAANVSKGALFHHFINKQGLVEAMITEQLNKFEANIEARMRIDTIAHGRFTRAYVSAIFDRQEFGAGTLWSAMASSAAADRSMRVIWRRWMQGQLQKNNETDGGTGLEIIRLAADGAWMSYLMDEVSEEIVDQLEKHLINLSLSR